MFTRKHFEQVASVLSAARNSDSASAVAAAYGSEIESIVHAEIGKLIDNISGQLADMFRDSNSRFDNARFVDACKAEDKA
ncbi:hypothetical protein LCGC14_1392100 [marine sediment metagenome]|uniref:Uncharacterized protein n=1 Tax=marine sediment metagenome TaxID=412755 RepID=A0A0F9MF60_9ZZZZ